MKNLDKEKLGSLTYRSPELIELHDAELEMERLEALICVVYEERHYDGDCECEECSRVRRYLRPRDLDFINKVGTFIRSSPHQSIPLLDGHLGNP